MTRGVKVKFSELDAQMYSYAVDEGMNLAVGDRVIVQVNNLLPTGKYVLLLKIAKVYELIDSLPVAPYVYRWVYQKIERQHNHDKPVLVKNRDSQPAEETDG